MSTKTHKTERIHALDSLRAIMMLLGLVLHSALTYNVTEHGDAWMLKDPNSTSLLTDYIVFLIHSFRMPIFFLVSGFFGALLFYERRPIKMIKNRIERIVFPFIIFIIILWPIIIFTFNYTSAGFSGNNEPLSFAITLFSTRNDFIPKTTFHLWFLYYLIFITALTVIIAIALKKTKKLTKRVTLIFDWIIQKPFTRILFMSVLTFLILTILGTSMIEASVSLIPELNTFTFYLFFYLIGWIFFKSKHYLDALKKYDWICTIIGIVLVTIQGLLLKELGLDPNSNHWILILLTSIIVWLFTFGITGLFLRYGSNHSKRMRYISDSSYWVYLIHLPLTVLFPVLIWELPLPALIKFIIIISLTAIVCFLSYHYMVRATFIGKFLNGKKYLIKKPS